MYADRGQARIHHRLLRGTEARNFPETLKRGRSMLRRTFAVLFGLSALLATTARAAPDIQSWTTEKGARVLFVEAHDLPMLAIRIVFDAGSARDGKAEGLARLTNRLLDQGAGGLDADALAEGLESRGAQLGSGSERDMAWLSLRSLSRADLLDPALELFVRIVTRPDFPKADFKRERRRMQTAAQYRAQKPSAIAEEAFYRAVYGDHPYATQPGGTVKTIPELTRGQVKDFYRRYYVAANAVVAIVGDADRARAEAIAARLTDALPAGGRAPDLPPVPDLREAKQQFIAHPSTQSHIWMGQPGDYRGDPDYFPLYVGNHSLGGSGLVSRISEEVREKRGLSYSAYSYFYPMRRKGPYVLGLQTRNNTRDEALDVLRDTLQTFIDKGPKPHELDAAKKNITGGFPIRVSSNSKIVEYLAVIGFYDLPLDYLQAFNSRVEAVTLEQIRDAFRRRVHPERMVTVVVGGEVKD